MKIKKLLLLTALLAAILFFIGLATDNQILRIISKPLPVLILAIVMPKKTKYQRFIFYGFLFSVLGDLLLELPYDLFMFGLLSFLLAHVSYIFAYLKRNKEFETIAGLILLSVGVIIFVILYPHLGEMKIAVAVYMLVILTMVWRSYAQRKTDKFAVWAFIGALSFLFSDTNIAFNKFCCPYGAANWVIMISYWLGQYLIFYSADKSLE